MPAALFRRFLIVLFGSGETLGFFAPDGAFPHVISATIVSHKAQQFTRRAISSPRNFANTGKLTFPIAGEVSDRTILSGVPLYLIQPLRFSFHSRIRTANASSRSLPKVMMPPSCPAMTRIFLLCTPVTRKSRFTSSAILGVP